MGSGRLSRVDQRNVTDFKRFYPCHPSAIDWKCRGGRKEGISGRPEGNSNELHDLLIRQRRRWITSYCEWRSKDTNRDKLLFVCVGGPNEFVLRKEVLRRIG